MGVAAASKSSPMQTHGATSYTSFSRCDFRSIVRGRVLRDYLLDGNRGVAGLKSNFDARHDGRSQEQMIITEVSLGIFPRGCRAGG